MCAHLYAIGQPLTLYRDNKYPGGPQEFDRAIAVSTTLYIGNLSFFTTEEQIYELFGRCGEIKRIIMGLDRNTRTPCGFCFVEYYTREDAEDGVKYINGTRLDDRVIRADWDAGFRESRQYGRGSSGGQVRDEYRTDYDSGRGGYGKQKEAELEREVNRERSGYERITEIPTGLLPIPNYPAAPQQPSSSSSSSLQKRRYEQSGSTSYNYSESPSEKKKVKSEQDDLQSSRSNETNEPMDSTSGSNYSNNEEETEPDNPRLRKDRDDNDDDY